MNADMEFGLSHTTLQKIRHTLARHPHVERAVIYGSRAKGNYKPGSDIDITLYAAQGLNIDYRELADLLDEIDDLLLPYSIDLSVFTQINNPELCEHIERVGKVMYVRGDMGTQE
jgi:predicted nucleotidyltransferase